MGVINVGGEGVITLDGKKYVLEHKQGIYIGMGTKEVEFTSKDAKNPAKFYINSCPAHKTYIHIVIGLIFPAHTPDESVVVRTYARMNRPAGRNYRLLVMHKDVA